MNSKVGRSLAVAVLLAGLAGCSVPTNQATTSDQSSQTTTAPATPDTSTPAAPAKPKHTAPPMTSGQKNALRSAKDYLAYQAFSKSGLIKQLKFEKYSAKDAVFAVNHLKVNWNTQAVKSAKDYLDYQAFSKKGLIDQLEFEGFTHAQAVYGATKVMG